MSASVLTLFKCLGLAWRLHVAEPSLGFCEAYEHAQAALDASTDRVSPELLLAIAFVESRFDVTATSRVEGKTRRMGRYPSTTPPPNLSPRSLFCGPLQTMARSWAECMALRDPHTAYAASVVEIERWLRDRRVRDDITRALAGYGCGNHGVTTGKCNMYPQRVLWQRRRFQEGRAPRVHAAEARRGHDES
jgi:hypothetical protein